MVLRVTGDGSRSPSTSTRAELERSRARIPRACSEDITTTRSAAYKLSLVIRVERCLEMSTPNRALAASAFDGGLRSGPTKPADATSIDPER